MLLCPAPTPLPSKPWHSTGALRVLGCLQAVSQLDIVVALQEKAVWELQQKQVEEASYL